MSERKIILADQRGDILSTFQAVFQQPDYSIETTSSASEMIAKVFMSSPDLIVLSANPEDEQNSEILKTIRANSTTSRIPALVVLPDDSSELKHVFSKAGECDFIVKPLVPERIKNDVETLIRGKNLFGSRMNSKIITFCGVKGGCGSTTMATNFAIAFYEEYEEVLLLELANYFSGIKPSLNIQSRKTVPFLMNEPSETMTSEHILSIIHEHETGIKTVATVAGISDMEKMDAQAVKFMRYHLCPVSDITVFDAGFGLTEAHLELFDISDRVIFVSTLDIASLYNLEIIAQVFEGTRLDISKCSVLFNHLYHQGEIPENTIKDLKGKVPILGFIPNHSAGFLKALNQSKPYMQMFPKSHIAKIIRSICEEIVDSFGDEEELSAAA